MNKKLLFPVVSLVILGAVSSVFYLRQNPSAEQPTRDRANILPISADVTPRDSELRAIAYINFVRLFGGEKIKFGLNLTEPVAGFKQNITKKPFSIFITPETSPVEGDKFTGYHTGVDSEFTETSEEIPVRAIADGTVVVSIWTKGYGGVVVIKHIIEEVPLFALYGHIDPTSFLPPGTTMVRAGDQIGILGDDHSEETDGARKHLHFSIYIGEKMDYRGYVQTEEELSNWLNPLDLY